MKLKTSKISTYVCYFILIGIFLVILGDKKWKEDHGVIFWDIISYYSYLPATFIYGDITLEFVNKDRNKYIDKFWPAKTPTGGNVIKTSMGMSILYAPFFFLGHVAAYIGDYDTGGFSIPYKIALLMSSLFFLGVGLYFLNKILLRYFSILVTSITLFALVVGTNLLHYVTAEATMSHIYNFSLIAVFIYIIIKWYENQSMKNTLIIGFLLGLIVLIRPTNVIVLFIFILYDIKSLNDLKDRISLFIRSYTKLILIAICALLVWVPQMLYWKSVSGQFLYFSYGEERFFFNNPQIIRGLFSYRNGWLVYTPLMIFAILGLILLWKKQRQFFWPILIFLVMNVYIITSWWNWWYGGSFGLRAFIDSYSLLAIPLAAFLSWFLNRKLIYKLSTIIVVTVIVSYNIFQNIQYRNGAIHYDSMTKEAYWEVFLKPEPTGKYWSLLAKPDYDKAIKGINVIAPNKD